MDDSNNYGRRFIYFYFNRDQPEKIKNVVPAHLEYWKTANPREYIGGPFADRRGGLISFVAAGLAEAEAIVQQDPFVLADLIEVSWIKEWIAESR